jgi:DNA polymerase-1
MTNSGVAPEWMERLTSVGSPPHSREKLRLLPLSRPSLAGRVHLIEDLDGAERLVQACHESPVSWIGFDSEFRNKLERPLYVHHPKSNYCREVRDIRRIHPFCLAFAVVSEDVLFRFVVDLRRPEVLPAVQPVLDLPVPVAAHFAKADLHVLWTLGLREPEILWDTYIAERALNLGRFRLQPRLADDESDPEAIRSRELYDQRRERRFSLEQVLRNYGLTHPFSGTKELHQKSFLSKPFGEEFTPTEIEYSSADAEAVAELYPRQRMACDRAGITQTLDKVVQPWMVNAAEIEWHGVPYDREQCELFLKNSMQIRERIEAELQSHGISNPGSPEQIARFLRRRGLDHLFPRTKTGQPSTRDEDLKQRQHLHLAIPLIRTWRKVRLLVSDPAVNGLLTAADGRVHPTLRVLGADTGRTQSQLPNVMGLGRDFRPLVRPPPRVWHRRS